jgi:hypothetical protein
LSKPVSMRPISRVTTFHQLDYTGQKGPDGWYSLVETPRPLVQGVVAGKVLGLGKGEWFPVPVVMFRRAAVAGAPSQFEQVDPLVRTLHQALGPRYSVK